MQNLAFVFLFTLTLNVFAQEELKQYPEQRNYTNTDRGMAKYLAKSLYGTGKFVLTFDDGPSAANTPRLLDILQAHGVHATFFVLTDSINDSMLPLLKRVLDEGHIIASHGRTHDHSNGLTLAAFQNNVRQSLLTLKRVYEYAGHPFHSIYFRYPYGEYGGNASYHHMNALRELSRELFGDNCIQFVFWDVDTADWVPTMTSEDIFTNMKAHYTGGRYYDFKLVNGKYVKVPLTMTNPPKGGVILQHDIHEKNLAAVEMYLNWIKTEAVQVVTLPEVDEFVIERECRFL